jgi:SAM-dependent methyltransferase
MTSTIHTSATSQAGPESPGSGRTSSPAVSTYTLGSNPAETERLRQQTIELHAHAVALIDHVGLRSGQSAIDIGCGPSGVLELLSEQVGPSGHVVGLDFDPAHVALARAFANERGLTNVEILQADATNTGLDDSSFDLVHARTVLVTIPDPTAVVREMVRLVRPGGWVAGEEADGVPFLCNPPHPAWDRLTEVFLQTWELDGADIHLGRRLPGLFQRAGLVEVGVEARADVYRAGHSRQTIHPDLVRSMGGKIVARGLISESELEELDRVVRAHLARPGTLTVPHLLFSAWGRKPVGAAVAEVRT